MAYRCILTQALGSCKASSERFPEAEPWDGAGGRRSLSRDAQQNTDFGSEGRQPGWPERGVQGWESTGVPAAASEVRDGVERGDGLPRVPGTGALEKSATLRLRGALQHAAPRGKRSRFPRLWLPRHSCVFLHDQ